jgi:hypothetical protein
LPLHAPAEWVTPDYGSLHQRIILIWHCLLITSAWLLRHLQPLAYALRLLGWGAKL